MMLDDIEFNDLMHQLDSCNVTQLRKVIVECVELLCQKVKP
jgi:hypothetical protein